MELQLSQKLEGLLNSQIRFLSIGYEGEWQMFESILFQSIIVEGEN